MSTDRLADQASRDLAAARLDHGLVMSAGAGAGKTHTLIERLAAVIERGLDDRRIVAITFTERAARDLTHKMRQRIPSLADAGDAVFVGTIHSFCLALLRRFPLEAGLPPIFAAQGELMNGADAAERIRRISWRFFQMVADRDDVELRDALDVVYAVGGEFHLDALIALIDREWDRFRASTLPAYPDWRRAVRQLDQIIDIASSPSTSQALRAKLGQYLPDIQASRAATSMLEAVRCPELKLGNCGDKETREFCRTVATEARAAVLNAAFGRVLETIVPVVIDEAQRRCTAGLISFDDILVLTRELLTTHADITALLRGEIGHLCVDEFQDTDPVQYDIVQLLTQPTPGEAQPVLFAVGDPKQSIYGFRRADVELFEELAARADLDQGLLSVNFRSRPRLLHWINETFAGWFHTPGQVPFAELVAHVPPGDSTVTMVAQQAAPSAAEAQEAQAEAIAQSILAIRGSKVVRDPHANDIERPADFADIAILVRRRGDLTTLEPTLTAAGIPYTIEGGVLLYDAREVRELLRVLRAVNDPRNQHAVVTALRTSVLACSDADLLRHRAVQGSSWNPIVPRREQVGDPVVLSAFAQLRAWARARHVLPVPELLARMARETFSWAASTTDVATVRASWRRLRAVLDEARYWFEQTGGSLAEYLDWVDVRIANDDRSNITTDEPDEGAVRILTVHAAKGLDFPVVVVAGLGGQRPSAENVRAQFRDGTVEIKCGASLVTAGYDKGREADPALEAARLAYVACTRARDHLVVSLAHKQGSVKNSAVELLPHQAAADELLLPLLPSVEPPAVADLVDPAEASGPPRRPPWRVRSSIAATQVSQADDPAGPAVAPWAPPGPMADGGDESLDDDVGADDDDEFPDGSDRSAGDPPASPVLPAGGGRAWSAVDSLHSKPPRSAQALPEQVGRYGTVVGRAVHGVLQRVDLDDPVGAVGALVVQQCVAEAVPAALHAYVESLVRSVLSSEAFARLLAAHAVSTVRREMYVGAQHGEQGVYGIIDAVWVEDGGFVVVDFKTDHARQTDEALAATYTAQLQAYAAALTAATGMPTRELLLCVAVADGSPATTVPIGRPTAVGQLSLW